MTRPRAVITGTGVVAPNGVGAAAFADACIAGRGGLKRPPDDEAYAGLRTSSIGRITTKQFDPASVLDAADLRRLPRVVPLALAACREALAEAKLDLSDRDVSRRVGLVLGTGGGGLAFVEEQYRGFFTGRHGASPFAITGGTHGNLAGELSIALGLHGPSHVVSNGCAASTDAVGYAFLLLRSGLCDAVVCGGCDAPIAPGILRAFERMGVVSPRRWDDPNRSSRPFDRDRDGLVVGEGAWMFVLERAGWRGEVEELAEVAGYASTCDAYHRVRIAPDTAECVRAMQDALADAGVGASDVAAMNLHGTSTEMNDRLETQAVRSLLGSRADTVPMSATKSLVGHPQGAAGAAGLAAAVLCARRGVVHPTANLTHASDDCDLDYVPREARPFPGGVLLCNCIAFGSKNSALALRVMPRNIT